MLLGYFHNLCENDTAMNHVRQFVAAARDLGHRIEVCPLNAGKNPNGGPGKQGTPSRIHRALSYCLHEPKELLSNLPNRHRVGDFLRVVRPEVALVRSDLFAFSPIVASRSLGIPVVLEVNSPAVESQLYLDQYLHLPFVLRHIEGWKLHKSDSVTVVSTTLKNYLTDRYSLAAEKFTVVPNGANLDVFHPEVAKDSESIEIFGRALVVGFVGSFEKWHGTDLLVEMIRRVASARPAVRFLLVGDGPFGPAVREDLGALGDRVLFTGRVPHDRVPRLVSSMDVGIMPESNFYGSPLKVVEWMAAGKAVVAPRYGPLEDIIDSGVDGLLFPPRDLDSLTESVLSLVDSEDRRRRLGEAAAHRVRTGLTWKHNATRVVEACQKARTYYLSNA